MGSSDSKEKEILSPLAKKSEKTKILIIGPDNAGKTTLVYQMKLGEVEDRSLIHGYWAQSVQYGNLIVDSFDFCPNLQNYQDFWTAEFKSTSALIFMMDLTDMPYDDIFFNWLFHLIKGNPELKGKPIVLFGNKLEKIMESDEASMRAEAVRKMLKDFGESLKEESEWKYLEGSVMKSAGIGDALQWIVDRIF